MAKSMQSYIDKNDFLGAVERLNSTNATWRSRWFETCRIIYEKCQKWAKDYILDPVKKAVIKIQNMKKTVKRISKPGIFVSENCTIENNHKGTEKCYLIEFFNAKKESICSKVGTTTRTIHERVREELNSKTYKNMGAESCVIHRVYDCGNIPAEGLESYFRAKYIRKYPNSFQKNDRFMNQHFDFAEADKICKKYLATA